MFGDAFMFLWDHILPIVIVLGVLIFVHELGHFLAAKLFGVRVERFSLGFPPRLFGVKIGETDYCVSAIPLGGYVKLSGMIDESLDSKTLTGAPHEFMSKPLYQKVIIISAGVIMNFVLAVGILGYMFWSEGEPVTPTTTIGYVEEGSIADSLGLQKFDRVVEINGVPLHTWQEVTQAFLNNLGQETTIIVERNGQRSTLRLSWDRMSMQDLERLGVAPLYEARVGDVLPDSPAHRAGLQRGDKIIAINDSAITDWMAMTRVVYAHPEKPLKFTVLRGADTLQMVIAPRSVQTRDAEGKAITIGQIGITRYTEYRQLSLFPAMVRGFQEAVLFGELNIRGFARMITGHESVRETLAGPVAIAQMAGEAAQQGWSRLMKFIAYLSVVLAIVNILPIPALDGGHLLIILIEGVRRKPISVRAKLIVQQIGMVFLLMLIFFVIFNDIARLSN
ncbi:MAG: RIP metalloprotease RseP [Calditrichaeota bacterium]|nr:MAG: RIP metalloprotease RseP [Calditrichota bacterium]